MLPNEYLYLDYNATTPVDPLVLQVMIPFFNVHFGNAASTTHSLGRFAADAVHKSREQVSQLINCESNELIFTSGSTEAINQAISSIGAIYRSKGRHIITWKSEHKAVLESCERLEKLGYQVSMLSVNREGMPDLEEFEKTITNETILVSAMLVNNETGVIFPIEAIAKITHAKNSLLFCDATQAPGKMHVDVNELGADLMCISAHKMYGPKGIGALFIRRKNPRVVIEPLLVGGGHERGLRSGTLNVPAIVGFGEASKISLENYWEEGSRISRLRTLLEQELTTNGGGYVNGSIRNRVANTSNIYFEGIRATDLISKTPSIAIATGSACTSALPEPSHVLTAMGLNSKQIMGSVRISLGRFTTMEDITGAIKILGSAINKLREK